MSVLGRITPKRVKVRINADGTKEIIEEVPRTSVDSLSLPKMPEAKEDAEQPADQNQPPSPRGRLIAKA